MQMDDLRERVPPRFEGQADRLTYLLAEYKIAVMLSALAAVLLFTTGRASTPNVPPVVTLILQGIAIGIIPAVAAGKLVIVDQFLPDPRKRVLEWTVDETSAATIDLTPHRVPRDVWQSRQHELGLPVIETDGISVVTDFSWHDETETLVVKGCDPEVADPGSVLATVGKLDAIYNELLDARKEAQHLRATANLRQHEIEQHQVNALIGAIEKGVNYEPVSDEVFEGDIFGVGDQGGRTDAVDPADAIEPTERESEAKTNGHTDDEPEEIDHPWLKT